MNCDSFNHFRLSDVVCYVCLNTVLIRVCKHMRVSAATYVKQFGGDWEQKRLDLSWSAQVD